MIFCWGGLSLTIERYSMAKPQLIEIEAHNLKSKLFFKKGKLFGNFNTPNGVVHIDKQVTVLDRFKITKEEVLALLRIK